MIVVHSDLARETGSFFKVAWETLVNAVAGKWGELKAIIPGGKRTSVRVAKGTFTHAFHLVWDGNGGSYSVDEAGAELMVLVIDEQAGTTKCFEGKGKVEISDALEAQKSYFVVVFGVM